MSKTQRRQLTRILCIGFIVSLLALLRVLWLDSDGYAGLTWSSELVTDEAFYCHDARNLILTGSIHVVGDNFHNALIMPLLHVIQVGVFRVFGVSLVASRMISVVFSFATMGLFYAACRRAFGTRVALPALLLLGFDHINLLYNRMALMDTPAQLPLVACFYAFVRAFPVVIENASIDANNAPNSSGVAIKSPTLDDEGTIKRGVNLNSPSPSDEGAARRGVGVRYSNAFWMACCGLLMMAAYAIRGLSALLLPALLFLAWRGQHSNVTKRSADSLPAPQSLSQLPLFGLLTGLALGLVVYICVWYLPNRASLQTVNHFYMAQQLMPRGLEEIRHNIGHSLFGNERGFSSYLFRHSPVQWTLALAWLLAWPDLRLRMDATQPQAARYSVQAIRFLMLWVGIMLTAFALVRYSPPRYYVLFYPALAALAALALAHIHEVARIITASPIRRALLGTLLIYHLLEAALQHRSTGADALLYGITIGTGLLLQLGFATPTVGQSEQPNNSPRTQPVSSSAGRLAAGLANRQKNLDGISRFMSSVGEAHKRSLLPISLMLLWGIINAGWLLDWAGHIRYTQRDCDRWMQQNLPANAVLIGDPAPGLTLRSQFTAINVIPGLCNDDRPVETFAGRPCYILIFEGPNPLRWWERHYPQWITPQHCIRRFVVFGKFRLLLYQAQPTQP